VTEQPELLEEWKALCESQGWKVTDRLQDLIAFDLNNNGVDLALIRKARESEVVARAADENALANEFINRIRELSKTVLDVQLKSAQEKRELIAFYEQELDNLRFQLKQARDALLERNEGLVKK